MSGRLLLALTISLGVIAVGIRVVRIVRASALDKEAERVRLRATLMTALCFVAVIAVLFSPVPAAEGVRLATLPAVAGILGVLAAGFSESLWRPQRGPSRVASLVIRRASGAEPDRGLRRRYLLGLAVSAALIIVGGLTAASDGRSLERTWATGGSSTGPYPGWMYGLPIAMAIALLAAATAWALRRVDARPVMDVDRPELDRAVRTGSRVRVLRFAAGATVLTAAGLAFTAGSALARLAQNLRMGLPGAPAGQAPWDWTQNAGFGLLGLALVLGLVAMQALLWGAPAIPRAESHSDAAREVSV